MAKAKLPVKKKRAAKKKVATKKPATKKETRIDKKLQKSRAVQEETISNRLANKVGDLQSELEQSQQREAKLQVIIKEQSQIIKGLQKLIADQKGTIAKQSDQIPKKKLQPWMTQKSSIEMAGNMFQICKQGASAKNPERFFPVGEILKGEIDTDATVDDIKDYVKGEFGKGNYKVKAFNEDLGHKVLRGSVRFQV